MLDQTLKKLTASATSTNNYLNDVKTVELIRNQIAKNFNEEIFFNKEHSKHE